MPTWNVAIGSGGSILKEIAEALIHTGWLGVPLFLFVSGYSLALGKTQEGTVLDLKKFYLNRILRIYPLYPLYLFCITMLVFTHHLSGATIASLLLLQTQDVPVKSPFHILWSIQLEFGCCLLFPIFLEAIIRRKALYYIFAAFIFVRIGLYFLPTVKIWQFSYGTIFGASALFLSGMLAASLPDIKSKISARMIFLIGCSLFVLFSLLIFRQGGFEAGEGHLIKLTWMFFPERFAGIAFLIVKGCVSGGTSSAPGYINRFVAHIGRISYSGYVFHLFVLDFYGHVVGNFFDKNNPYEFIVSFSAYFMIVIIFSHVTYNAIELPFLKHRKIYSHSENNRQGSKRYLSWLERITRSAEEKNDMPRSKRENHDKSIV